jgi:hypothetical protein
MRGLATIKIIGSKKAIYEVIDGLKVTHNFLRVSRLIPSVGVDKSNEFHVFIDVEVSEG